MSSRHTAKPDGYAFGRMTLLLLIVLFSIPNMLAAQPDGLARAHAHNDYEHERPLLDALAHGFNSVEVDVYLVDGALLVAHDREDVRPERTLEKLYLDPLRAHIRQHGGHVHPGLPPLTLLIDIKSEGEATYRALHDRLREYGDIFTLFSGDVVKPGPVTAIISGNRPRALMQASPVRFAAYDGRLSDLHDAPAPPSFMPLVSDRWDRITRWHGEGPLPDSARQQLRKVVKTVHAQGRRLRFWGAPDQESVWQVLHEAGVDFINTDDLAGLRAFLIRQR